MSFKRVFIARSAQEVVFQGAKAARRSNVEFGGSVLAMENSHHWVVTHCVPTGEDAFQGSAHIVTDHRYQNRAVEALTRKFPKIGYVGDWHIHPMYMPQLSHTDRMTAAAMLEDECRHRQAILLLLCTLRDDGQKELLAFDAKRSRGGIATQSLQLELIEDHDRMMMDALGGAYVSVDSVLEKFEEDLDLDHPNDHETPRHQHTAHIAKELEIIESKLDATTHLIAHGSLLAAEIRRNDSAALVIFPPEYPYGAPHVFSGGLHDTHASAVELKTGWSSLHELVDPVQRALHQSLTRRRPFLLGRYTTLKSPRPEPKP